MKPLQNLLRGSSALSCPRSPLAYLLDMSRGSLRDFAQLSLLITVF